MSKKIEMWRFFNGKCEKFDEERDSPNPEGSVVVVISAAAVVVVTVVTIAAKAFLLLKFP